MRGSVDLVEVIDNGIYFHHFTMVISNVLNKYMEVLFIVLNLINNIDLKNIIKFIFIL